MLNHNKKEKPKKSDVKQKVKEDTGIEEEGVKGNLNNSKMKLINF